MSDVFGKNLTLTLFGESHGEYIGATLDGFKPGFKVDEDNISAMLAKRRPSGKGETQRVEKDAFKIISGVYNGYTTGEPITVIIPNENIRSGDYDNLKTVFRPSHADYTVYVKSHGFCDGRGGGHTSGRLTAPIVALGAIVIDYLKQKGINIATHILSLGGVQDTDLLNKDEVFVKNAVEKINSSTIPVIDDVQNKMVGIVEAAAAKGDSIGGKIQTVITGLDAGIGEPWFDSLESRLSSALFSIGGIKGVEFGLGFGFDGVTGSKVNDAFFFDEDGKIKTKTNNNGGINGGISNGMDVIFNAVVKPTPSISIEQDTVDIQSKQNVKLSVKGRHDPAIIRRICPVVTAMTALTIADFLK